MTNDFELFQKRNQLRSAAQDIQNGKFVFSSYPSTIIESDDVKVFATVVNEQEKEQAYIYTQHPTTLTIGSVWTAKTLHFIITEEIIVMKNVSWHKYRAELCNVQIGNLWGRFIGTKYINVSLQEKSVIASMQKPVIVLPNNTLKFGETIVINERAWLVQEYDNISTPGITYYSLTTITVPKQNNGRAVSDYKVVPPEYEITHTETTNSVRYTHDNELITLATENGYCSYSNKNIKIAKHTGDIVQFMLPFGVDNTDITVKQAGEYITYTYNKE